MFGTPSTGRLLMHRNTATAKRRQWNGSGRRRPTEQGLFRVRSCVTFVAAAAAAADTATAGNAVPRIATSRS